jgi:hypothetical protein
MRVLFYCLCRYRDAYFNRVLAPEGEILFFASPKESIQRKGDPDAAGFLRIDDFIGVCHLRNMTYSTTPLFTKFRDG